MSGTCRGSQSRVNSWAKVCECRLVFEKHNQVSVCFKHDRGVQVFSRVKRDNDRRCVVDKMITFNTDFTVETREFPGSIKGVRDGQRPASAAGKRRPQSALM